MASTFFGLTIAYSGLQAANTSLTITGHNVSNINTKGYTKQQAGTQAADALRYQAGNINAYHLFLAHSLFLRYNINKILPL